MLTAWIVCSTLLGLAGMFAELRRGAPLVTALAGFVCMFVLWPLAFALTAMTYVLVWIIVLCKY